MQVTTPANEAGRLVYLMGPSGVGKDSLIDYARTRLADDAGVVFLHRYITRPAAAGGENHIALSEAEFELRLRHGLFLFAWRSHGLRYGIGLEARECLARGLHVVVNGSRAYLHHAHQRVGSLLPVLVRAPAERRHERLRGRGRETDGEVRRRLQRGEDFELADVPGLRVIDNDGSLEAGGERLVSMLRTLDTETRLNESKA